MSPIFCGPDRYVMRTVFEPFVADVNYIFLEASTEAGLENAVAKFTELLQTLPAHSSVGRATRFFSCASPPSFS